MRNAKYSQLVVLGHVDSCVIAGFYALVVAAALAFSTTWWLPVAQADDYIASSWICIFGAALCLLMRLAVLVWEDAGDVHADQPS
ncbi:MAG: hypothetical protein JWP29_2553 [Rhodoferax sp.]|nr:hypothetical protein [Rhodoferax sp.]